MGKFDKYKKTTQETDLDKYKKKSGESFDDLEKKFEKKEPVLEQKNDTNASGTIIIVVLGIVTVIVWILAIGKILT